MEQLTNTCPHARSLRHGCRAKRSRLKLLPSTLPRQPPLSPCLHRWMYLVLLVTQLLEPTACSVLNQSGQSQHHYSESSNFREDYDFRYREEVERLRRLPENERLITSIPTRFYEVTFPVQMRHHDKMGISTRDDRANQTSPPRHYNVTSLLIKAFKYKFRLDLKLNEFLLAPQLVQKHLLPDGAQHISTQEQENCYYHGQMRDYPGSLAALSTCHGVSGVIHLKNETFVIQPFIGGDLSTSHPHVIYKYSSSEPRAKHTCGNSRMHEWGFKQYRRPVSVAAQQHQEQEQKQHQRTPSQPEPYLEEEVSHEPDRFSSALALFTSSPFASSSPLKSKRDVRAVEKFIELGIVLDQSMYTTRNFSLPRLVHDALQIINIVDLYYSLITTRVSVVYIETWTARNQIDVNDDVRQTLLNFIEYATRKLYQVTRDATHLFVGQGFSSGEVGIAVPDSLCTTRAVGVSQDISIYAPHITASSVTHMLGHNMGLGHDTEDSRGGCKCADWWGCIMAKDILGMDNTQPYHFSKCSVDEFNSFLKVGHGICLFNKPSQVEDFGTCGNGVVDEGEQCDCGNNSERCDDPCCDPFTCRLTLEAECSNRGACCSNCKLKKKGAECRSTVGECDLAERCDGHHGECPPDVYKKNGLPCKEGQGFCYNGECPTLNEQCSVIWGENSRASDPICFQQFNAQGTIRGNCGLDGNGNHVKCTEENLMCGSLQCQFGNRVPMFKPALDQEYSMRTMISTAGAEYECKVVRGSIREDIENMGLIQDGTKCGDRKLCLNQTCFPLSFLHENDYCPMNSLKGVCSGQGTCTNVNTCACDIGWEGPDCALPVAMSELDESWLSQEANHNQPSLSSTGNPPATLVPLPADGNNTFDIEDFQKKTVKDYESNNKSLSAPQLVMVLVSIVGGVFIFFALLAMCYRRRSLMPDKAERALLKKQMEARGMFPGGTPTFPMDGAHGAGNSNSLPRIITFGSMPSYREDKMIELKQQQQSKSSQTPTGLPPPPPPISMPPSAPSSAQHIYPKENRKDSATSPVDPSLMDLEDELLLMDDNTPARFIELSPNNLPKLSVKPDRQSGRWASILSQTLPLADLATAANAPPPAVTSAAANSISTPLVLTDEHLHHSRHSLHRQSSQGSAGSESPLTEMERTLKSFNGYHEDILEALQSVSQQRQHHQKSLECIRTPGGSSSGATVGPGGGDGSGPASLGRQTPNELKKAFLESDYGGLIKINEHFQKVSSSEPHLMPCAGNGSTIKIRNLAHLLQQLGELNNHQTAPGSVTNSDDIRLSTEYGGSSGSAPPSSRAQQPGGGSRVLGHHPITAPGLSLDSQYVDQNLAYLLGAASDESAYRRAPRMQLPNQQMNQRSQAARNLLYPTPTASFFTNLPPLSPSTTTSTTTSTAREGHEDEAEEYDYEENGFGFSAYEPAIAANSITSTFDTTTTTTAEPDTSVTASATAPALAAKHGTSSSEPAEQLLYSASSVARRDKSSVSVSTSTWINGPSHAVSSTISRFTVTPVEETEESLIGQLRQIRSDDESDTSKTTRTEEEEELDHRPIELMSETSETTGSVSSCCYAEETSKPQEQPSTPTNQVFTTTSILLSSTTSSSTYTSTASSSAASFQHSIAQETKVKLYRKHRPSMQYQEYKV